MIDSPCFVGIIDIGSLFKELFILIETTTPIPPNISNQLIQLFEQIQLK